MGTRFAWKPKWSRFAKRSRSDNGIVIFAHRGYNQRNEIVMTCKHSALMLRRPKP